MQMLKQTHISAIEPNRAPALPVLDIASAADAATEEFYDQAPDLSDDISRSGARSKYTAPSSDRNNTSNSKFFFLYSKIRKLNKTQSKFDLDYFDYVNVGGCEQRERIANSLAQ